MTEIFLINFWISLRPNIILIILVNNRYSLKTLFKPTVARRNKVIQEHEKHSNPILEISSS